MVVALAGCDGGPDFGTNVEVVNGCSVDLAVVILSPESPPPDWDTGREIDHLPSGQGSIWLLNPITPSEPNPEYLWVAQRGSSTWGSPFEFDVGSLPETGASSGRADRVLRIEGDMCPKA